MRGGARAAAVVFLAAASLLLLVGAAQRWSPWFVVYNATPSIALGLYLAQRAPLANVGRHDIVCVRYAPPDWAAARGYLPAGMPLCKPVLGLPAEGLTVRNSRVYVTTSQGPLALGAYAHADSEGRLLPRAALPERIPLGHYFIGVPEKPNSLDSRYLGLVSSAQINSRLYPIWTW